MSQLPSPPPHTSPYNHLPPNGNTPTHRAVQASKDPVDIYDNAVLTPEELPIAKRPKYYPLAKGALLFLCCLGLINGLYSIILGAYVQARGGITYPELHDMPYRAVIASFFVGGFTTMVSLTLLTVAYRNWHPSLITFGLFVTFIIFSEIAMDRLLAPGPLLREQQFSAFRQVSATTAKQLVADLGCCGYLNSTNCNLTGWGIPPGPGVTSGVVQTPVPTNATAAAKAKRSVDQHGHAKEKLVRRQQAETTGTGAVDDTAPADPNAPADTGATAEAGTTADTGAIADTATSGATAPVTATTAAAAAAAPAASVIPQNGPGVPLPTSSAPTVDPTAGSSGPNTGAVSAPLVESGYPTCDKKLNPLIDAKLKTIRSGYIIGSVFSCLQLIFLGAFWHILGQWKRSRGVGRW